MNGDDGYVYSLFVENQGYWDESAGVWKDQNMVNLYKVLPYQPAPKVSLKVGRNWWDALNNMDMQISKGYVYYSEKENHLAGLYQPRSLIKIRRLSDGNTQTVMNIMHACTRTKMVPGRVSGYPYSTYTGGGYPGTCAHTQ